MSINETSFQKIKADLKRYAAQEGKNRLSLFFVLRMFLLTAGFQFVFTRRVQEVVHRIPIVGRLLRRIVWWWSCIVFGSELAIAAEIAGGLYIPHPYGIVVGAAKIGRNVTLLQNVTIGRRRSSEPHDPVIGDNVMIAAGAVVLGAITIGSNASVGANSVLMQDVPEGATAIGSPARILTRQ